MTQPTYCPGAPWYKNIHWPIAIFLIAVPITAFVWTPIHIYLNGLEAPVLWFFFLYAAITMTCITAGYHRLFSHVSYKASPILKAFYLFFGAGAFQSSALKWASDHRRHHRFEDTETDPYSINKGFFFAHFGWMLMKDDPKYHNVFEKDLASDPLVVFQHKYYIPLAFFSGFGVPTLVGWALGSPVGGLVIAGFLRICVSQHLTFFINSAAHMFGKQTYSDKITARDNGVLAILTWGEGYHNFHHRFQGDYRNGINWYQWDPTKWLIKLLSFFGLARDLRRVPAETILKARMQMEEKALALKGVSIERFRSMREKVETASDTVRKLKLDYLKAKQEVCESSRESIAAMKLELKLAQLEFRMAFRQWRTYRRSLYQLAA